VSTSGYYEWLGRPERLMRVAGLQGVYRRKGRRNLVNQATEEDLV
jgi:putative transposase